MENPTRPKPSLSRSGQDYRQDEIILNLERLRDDAMHILPDAIFDYIDGGAGREATVRANRQDFEACNLQPLVMRDVSATDLGTCLLGRDILLPLGFSPTALHRLVHPDGEIASARAAHAAGLPLSVSAMSSIAVEEIAEHSSHDNLWLQTYVFKDREVAPSLIARAEAAGFKAVMITVGSPVMGIRDRNLLNRFELPPEVEPAHFRRHKTLSHNNPIASFDGAEIDPAATWKDVAALAGRTRLPVLVKGIMNPLDVEPSLDAGVSGLVVSNHGGRQLDTSASTISVLPRIAATLNGRAALLVDGGFRRGTDVLKALAFGADAVLLGRPLLWALAVGGAAGVTEAIARIGAELRVAMQLAGCPTIASLRRNADVLFATPADSLSGR